MVDAKKPEYNPPRSFPSARFDLSPMCMRASVHPFVRSLGAHTVLTQTNCPADEAAGTRDRAPRQRRMDVYETLTRIQRRAGNYTSASAGTP